MTGAEFIELLTGREKLPLPMAIAVMKEAQEDGYSAFESGVVKRKFRMSYDVYAEQDHDGAWSFTMEAMQ